MYMILWLYMYICMCILLHFWMFQSAIESRIRNIHQHPLVQPLHTHVFEWDIYSKLQWPSFLGLHIYYQCWAGTVEQWLFFVRCPPLKRLALTSPTISSSRSPWSSISSATQPHWRTAANLQWSSKNIRLWRTNTGVFRPRWPRLSSILEGFDGEWKGNSVRQLKKVMGLQCFFRCEFCFDWFQKRIAFYWILMGFCEISLKWHCLERKIVIWKKGTIFWCPKIFTVPKKAWCEPERPVRRWRFSSFSLRSPLIGSILCPMKPRHFLPKWVKKGWEEAGFSGWLFFFFRKKNKLSPRSRRNEMEKWFLKFGAEAYKVDLRQESCSDSCCQTHWIPHRHLWVFLMPQVQINMSPPPALMFCFFPFHIPFGLMPHCQWKNTCQVALLDRKFDSRQVFGNIWPFPFPHLSTFQPQGDPAQSTAISNEQANLYASLTEYSLRVNEEKIRQCMRWDAERV